MKGTEDEPVNLHLKMLQISHFEIALLFNLHTMRL